MLGLNSLLILTTLLAVGAHAQCFSHAISYTQKPDQYAWSMTWTSFVPFTKQQRYFSESAGAVLEKHSEVVKNMWWQKRGISTGNLASWIMADSAKGKAKEYFLRSCKIDKESVFCQLNPNEGGAMGRINWAWSKVSCTKSSQQSSKCIYHEAGSVRGAEPFATAPFISVAINTQAIKDALRLAVAAEYGEDAVLTGFASARFTADAVWDQSQLKFRAGSSNFKIEISKRCETARSTKLASIP